MESLLFHPKVVHVPMALGILMPLIAAVVLVLWWRGWLARRGWLLVVGLQGILLASGVLALQSGEAEEERVEPVVAEQAIEAHERAAELFVWGSAAVLGLMTAGALLSRPRPALTMASLATLGTVGVLALGYRTGDAGGRLVYQHGAAIAHAGDVSIVPLEDDDD